MPFCHILEKIFMPVFGDRLKTLRGGESQSSFAMRFNLKQSAYSRYEAGSREPDLALLCLIARVCNVTTDWLLGMSGVDSSVSVNAGSGAAVAIGTGAKASAGAAKKAATAADCRKCPYKSWGEKFRKAGGIIPGI